MPELRIATLNILHGLSLDTGRSDEAGLRSAAAALDADVVALQEVDRLQPRSGHLDQAALVASGLGADHVRFVPTLRGTPGAGRPTWTPWVEGDALDGGPTYGVALVSRLPVRSWQVRRFRAAPVGLPMLVPAPGRARLLRVADEPRAVVAAVLEGPGGLCTVASTHLSFVPGFNVRQLRAITRWLSTMPAPRILLGDLNIPGSLPGRLTGWAQLCCAPTYPAHRPRVQLDHALADGLGVSQVRDASVRRLAVSDHCALALTCRLG